MCPLIDWVLARAGASRPCSIWSSSIARSRMRPGLPTRWRYRRRRRRRRAAARSVAPRRRAVDAGHRHRSRWSMSSPAPICRGCSRIRARRSSRAASHFWLTSEGVFGVALGVSTNFIFLFVLFGALLEKAGAGNYFIQLAVLAARTIPRRPGQGRGGVVGHDRHDLRLVGRQRGHHRHLHDPADEARRLLGGQGRRDRMRGRRQRPVDAAGDGRGRVPDGRVCRHHLCRGRASTPSCRRS